MIFQTDTVTLTDIVSGQRTSIFQKKVSIESLELVRGYEVSRKEVSVSVSNRQVLSRIPGFLQSLL